MRNLAFSILLLSLLHTAFAQDAIKTDDCVSPWQKVTDDMCILLNSGTKSWSHAKYLCNFKNSSLLFIDNEAEQTKLISFLKPLVKYRFTSRPYVWFDAVLDNSVLNTNDAPTWKWSNTEQTLTYSNWISRMDDLSVAKCGCLKVRDSLWRNCDCLSVQHFICRKPSRQVPKSKESDINQVSNVTPVAVEAKEPKEVSPIISADQLSSNIATQPIAVPTSTQPVVVSEAQPQNLNPKKNHHPINMLRMKIRKTSHQFWQYECPLGFGFYALDEDPSCRRYRICDNWDNIHAFLIVNKCPDGTMFDFKDKKCVEDLTLPCTPGLFTPR